MPIGAVRRVAGKISWVFDERHMWGKSGASNIIDARWTSSAFGRRLTAGSP